MCVLNELGICCVGLCVLLPVRICWNSLRFNRICEACYPICPAVLGATTHSVCSVHPQHILCVFRLIKQHMYSAGILREILIIFNPEIYFCTQRNNYLCIFLSCHNNFFFLLLQYLFRGRTRSSWKAANCLA